MNIREVVMAVVEVGVAEVGMMTIEPWHCVTALVSRVTAAPRAYSPPLTETPVVTLIAVVASMLPLKIVLVPRVAELPTCQKTLQALAPLMSMTEEADAVVMVLPIWNTHCALGSPTKQKGQKVASSRKERNEDLFHQE